MIKRKTQAQKDRDTLEALGRIYCDAHHGQADKDSSGLCPFCRNVVETTFARSQSCPNGHEGNYEDCSIKCQRGEEQKNVKRLMAYSAPRMLFRHPLMTITYLRKKFASRRPSD